MPALRPLPPVIFSFEQFGVGDFETTQIQDLPRTIGGVIPASAAAPKEAAKLGGGPGGGPGAVVSLISLGFPFSTVFHFPSSVMVQ